MGYLPKKDFGGNPCTWLDENIEHELRVRRIALFTFGINQSLSPVGIFGT
jgi:hypothetical protein